MIATLPPTASYSLCDSVIPSACAGYPNIATYADGPYAADPADLPYHSGETITIDVTGGDPAARALDVEPSDATPADAGEWVEEHHQVSDRTAIVYSDQSEWPAIQAAVAADAPGVPVKYWEANPGGGMVPGSDATQEQWLPTVDLSETLASFWNG